MIININSKILCTAKFIIPKLMKLKISLKTRGKLLKVDTPKTLLTSSEIAKLLVNMATMKATSLEKRFISEDHRGNRITNEGRDQDRYDHRDETIDHHLDGVGPTTTTSDSDTWHSWWCSESV